MTRDADTTPHSPRPTDLPEALPAAPDARPAQASPSRPVTIIASTPAGTTSATPAGPASGAPAEATSSTDADAATPFATALREAIAERGLSLDRIKFRLQQRGHDLSIASLSYWQSGRSRPDRATSLAALGTLEEILQVPRGQLAKLLPPRRPRVRRENATHLMVADLKDAVRTWIERTLAEWELGWDDGLEHLSMHEIVQIQPGRRSGRHTIREIVRAQRDSTQRYPVFLVGEPAEQLADVVAVTNCRVGRYAEEPDLRIVAAELVLDHRMWTGESLLVEYAFDEGGAENATSWERGFQRQLRDYALEISFCPDDLPTSITMTMEFDGVREITPLELSGSSLVLLRHDVTPGTIRVTWRWDDPE